jgi:preflagellin peptidase FlaK
MATAQIALDLLRVVLCSTMLLYSSFKDLKTREVSNWTWIAFAPLGILLDLYEGIYLQAVDPISSLLLPVLLSSGMSVIFFYGGLYGGADAKAFITLSLLVPHPLESLEPYLGIVSSFFPLSVFTDSALIAAFFALSFLVRNLLWRARSQHSLFEGLEEESLWRKALALLSCTKVEAGRLRGPPYQYPAEVIVNSKRRLHLLPDMDSDEAASASFRVLTEDLGLREVWVSPTLPFLLFISLGFFCSLLLGDIALWALNLILY